MILEYKKLSQYNYFTTQLCYINLVKNRNLTTQFTTQDFNYRSRMLLI
jgi:hypothetical protein